MTGVAEVAIAVGAFLLEMMGRILIFTFFLLRALFDGTYREQLRAKWNASNREKAWIVMATGFYLAGLFAVIWIWAFWSDHPDDGKFTGGLRFLSGSLE